MRRLSTVERKMRALHANDRPTPPQNFCNAPLGDWKLPGPHSGGMVSLGKSVHHDLTVKSDNRTTAEIIASLVAGK